MTCPAPDLALAPALAPALPPALAPDLAPALPPVGWLLLIFSLCKTPLGETGCLGSPYFLFY